MPVQGLYAAASGMIAIEAQQSTVANNIANASTAGYKRLEPVNLGFYQTFMGELRHPAHYTKEAAPAGGVKLVETFPDMSGGTLAASENPLHMALRGRGYFVVDTPNGERYTRSGNFAIDTQSRLTTHDGYLLKGQGGTPITVPNGKMIVDSNGMIHVNGLAAGQLQMVEFAEPERLEREGDSLLRASEEVAQTLRPAEETMVEHGSLEMSNVNLPHELTSMVLGMRAYEANQRVILAFDTTIGALIDRVAFPG